MTHLRNSPQFWGFQVILCDKTTDSPRFYQAKTLVIGGLIIPYGLKSIYQQPFSGYYWQVLYKTLFFKGYLMAFLPENVRRLRKSRGLTQKQFAALIGTSHPRISEIERGLGNPTLSTIESIASALRTTPCILITRDSKKASRN